jgi:hypothetical protein
MDDGSAEDALRRTLKILEESEVPPSLLETAFGHVWVAITGQSQSGPTGAGSSGPAARTPADDGSPAAAFARRLNVDPDIVTDMFALQEDGTFRVQIPSSKLPVQKPAATRELALLVCAGRQYAVDESTPASVIRAVCEDYGKLDSGNFAFYMSKGDHFWSIVGSAKGNKNYKLRKTGWEEAGALVRRLAGL